MKTRLALYALVGVAAIAGGCASTPPPQLTPAEVAPGTSLAPEALWAPDQWRLTELGGQAVIAPSGDRALHLVFEKDAARIHGFAGCNNFFGGVSFGAADRIGFTEMGATMMACPGMETESAFLEALKSVDSYFTDGRVLKLHRARMAPVAVFEAVSAP